MINNLLIKKDTTTTFLSFELSLFYHHVLALNAYIMQLKSNINGTSTGLVSQNFLQ